MNWQFPNGRHFSRLALSLLPGMVTVSLVLLFFRLGVWQPLEFLVYDMLFRVRGPIPWDDRVVLVAIDEASLQTLGRFPWTRDRYTAVLNVLSQAEASVIALDILFSEPSAADGALAEAMAQHGRVVLAMAWDSNGIPLLPTPTLAEAAIAQGHIYEQQDTDGLTRAIEPQIRQVPTLGVATAQVYSLVREPVALPNLEQPLWLNWYGPAAETPQYSFADVMQGNIPAEVFQDKIVIIGITAAGFDSLQTPYNRNPPATSVLLQATLINNILNQNFLQVSHQRWVVLILVLGGPWLSCGLVRLGTRQQLVAVAGLCVIWALLGLLLFQLGHWIPIALPIGLFCLTAGAVALQERLKENFLLQREISRLWNTHHASLVVRANEFRSPLVDPMSRLLPKPSVPLLKVAQLAALAEEFGRSQSAQAAIARSLSIGLLAADLDGTVWFCNPVASACLKLVVGDRLQQRLVPEWIDDAQWQSQLQALEKKIPLPPMELQRGDRWFELRLEPLFYPLYNHLDSFRQWHPDGLLLILEDITNRKQIEANLQQQMQELHEMSLLKDDFLSTVSHELRAPIANMKMAIHMLQLAKSDAQRDRYLTILQDECAREASLIDDLLDLQRLESGAKTSEPELIHLQSWIPHIVESFQERAVNRQLQLEVQLDSTLPDLMTDRPSLDRVLIELINNACKYTPPSGEITVAASATTSQVCLSVSNSGPGIPETELPYIFEKFYRVLSGDRWKQGGTGLGLALVKKLVECLGGSIHVSSQPGQTTFTVCLPLVPSEPRLS